MKKQQRHEKRRRSARSLAAHAVARVLREASLWTPH